MLLKKETERFKKYVSIYHEAQPDDLTVEDMGQAMNGNQTKTMQTRRAKYGDMTMSKEGAAKAGATES